MVGRRSYYSLRPMRRSAAARPERAAPSTFGDPKASPAKRRGGSPATLPRGVGGAWETQLWRQREIEVSTTLEVRSRPSLSPAKDSSERSISSSPDSKWSREHFESGVNGDAGRCRDP